MVQRRTTDKGWRDFHVNLVSVNVDHSDDIHVHERKYRDLRIGNGSQDIPYLILLDVRCYHLASGASV
jgi:hypothetical protein